ncbi:MAG: hypothetical protein LBT19_02545 [Candidatus Nomurabacteria bacterium]|jgi:hypothetical protein|nr:hypothetical protein [Candidatus Nomurabacteria bacterium]
MKGLQCKKLKTQLQLLSLLLLPFACVLLFGGQSANAASFPVSSVVMSRSASSGANSGQVTVPLPYTLSGLIASERYTINFIRWQTTAMEMSNVQRLDYGGSFSATLSWETGLFFLCGYQLTADHWYERELNNVSCPGTFVVGTSINNTYGNYDETYSVHLNKSPNSNNVTISFSFSFVFYEPQDVASVTIRLGSTTNLDTYDRVFFTKNTEAWASGLTLPAFNISSLATEYSDNSDIVDAVDRMTEEQKKTNEKLDEQNRLQQEQNEREKEGEDNIENQDSPDIGNESTATNIIGYITGFVSAALAISPTNCNINMDTGYVNVGQVNLCSGGLPTLVPIITSAVAVSIFIPYAYIMIKRIFAEIRSFSG